MTKSHIGANVTDQEKATVEKQAETLGLTVSDYVKAKLGLITPPSQSISSTTETSSSPSSSASSSAQGSIRPVVTEEEHRSSLRIRNVLLGSLHPAALDENELKRLDLIQRIFINKHKLEKYGSSIIDIKRAPELEPRALAAPGNYIGCWDNICDELFPRDQPWLRTRHMMEIHKWDAKRIAECEVKWPISAH